jgi:hypothetical protein
VLGRLSRIGRSPLRQIYADDVPIGLLPPDPAAVARPGRRRPDHTAATLIRLQLRRSATTGAAVRNIDHNDVAVV